MQLLEPVAPTYSTAMEQAVLETLAYSDVFDYPLRGDELHRYLPLRVTRESLQEVLDRGVECAASQDGFYFLAGREQLVPLRLHRERISHPALRQALRFGRILAGLPFIRMVALTGSLAVLNSEQSGDLDYMLVAADGHVWTARGFSLLFGRLTARAGHTLCPNLIVSESSLEWPARDIYSAREICQMIPISDLDLYARMRQINHWTERLMPNAAGAPPLAIDFRDTKRHVQAAAEWPLRGSLGRRLENWEMNRKVRRLRLQAGFGVETRFDSEVCQGNFLHHGAHTRQALEERLAQLGIRPSLSTPPIDSD